KYAEIADHFAPNPVNAPKDVDLNALLRTLPTIDIVDRAGITYTDWRDVLSHGLTDPWWGQFPYYKGNEKVDAPALFVNSWQDFGVNETLFEFNFFRTHGVSAKARDNQFVIISPTTHCDSELMTAPTKVGERELGDARFDFWSVYLNWYAYWLKGEKNA